MTPESKFVTVGDMRLHYVDWGTPGNLPLICLHGYTSHSRIWDYVAEAARDKYHVIGLDQRGHGESGWATDGYKRDSFVADLEGFIDDLGFDKVTLVGLSMGGWHAMLYAPAHPERVDRVVLVDIGPEVGGGRPRARRSRTPDEPTPSAFDSLEHAYAFARRRNPKPPDDLLRTDITHSLRQRGDGKWIWRPDPAMLSGSFDDPRSPDMISRYWAALEATKCPVLLVRGGESDLVSDEVVTRMKAANPKVSAIDVPDSGHNVPVDKPEEFIDAVGDFLGLS